MKPFFTLFLTALLCGRLIGQTTLAEHHFEAEGITRVSVEGAFCDVYVSQGDKVLFDGLIKGAGDHGDYVIASIHSGTSVVFKVERKKEYKWSSNIDVARLDLVVPDGIELIVENSSGNVKISQFRGDRLEVSASSGDLQLSGIQCNAYLKTTSGDLSLKDAVGDVTMRSTSGDQEFYDLSGDLRTGATSGDVVVVRLKGDLEVEATSGDVELNEVQGAVEVSTTSGNIHGDYVLLTGDSRMKSTSGNIAIDLKNNLEEVSFDLRATSGDLRVQNLEVEGHLLLDRGGLKVTGVSTSGDQTYKN